MYGRRLYVLYKELECFRRFALSLITRCLLARADEYYNYESNDGDDGYDGYEIFSYLYNGNGRLKQITAD